MSKAKMTGLMTSLQKEFGEKAVMWADEIPRYEPITSGSLALDFAVGIGGLPSDRVIEICGKQGTGKTTLALLAMQQFLAAQPDRGALILDLEHKMTPEWLADVVGVNTLKNRIIYIQPDHIEQATNIYRQAVSSGQVCFAMLDSIGGAPTVRSNDDAEVARFAGNSMGVGEFGRSAAAMSAKHRCLTVGINQTRDDMSGRHGLNTPGGHAWKHAIILQVELVRGKEVETYVIKGEKVPVGHIIYAKIRKNQLAAPGRTAMYWFFNVPTPEWGFGVDTLDEICRLGVLTKVIKLGGSWYSHPALPPPGTVQGLKGLKALVRADEQLRKTLSKDIIASLDDYASEVAPMTDPEAPIPTFLAGGGAAPQ